MWKLIFEGVWLSAMSVMDIRNRKIPLWAMGIGAPAAIYALAQEWAGGNLGWIGLAEALIPGALLLLVALTKKAGYADGVILILLGLVSGGKGMMGIFYISLLLMSLFVIFMLALHRTEKGARFPYLPFLLAGWILGRLL